MNKLLAALGVFALCSCSNDRTAGGTSSSENSRIAGVTTSSHDSVRVMIWAVDHDPVKNNDTLAATVVASGKRFNVDVPAGQSYNIVCMSLTGSEGAFVRNIRADHDSVSLADTIKCSALKVTTVCIDSGAVVGEKLFFEGTPFVATIGITGSDSGIAQFVSIPSSTLPALVLVDTLVDKTGTRTTLLDSVQSADTVVIGNGKSGPLWHIPLMIEVQDSLYDSLGGPGVFEATLKAHLAQVDSIINAGSGISGRIVFSADSIVRFTDSAAKHMSAPPAKYSLKILYSLNDPRYSHHGTNYLTHIAGRTASYMMQFSPTYDVFSLTLQRSLAEHLAESRGAINTLQTRILPQDDPMTGLGYTPSPGLMYLPDQSQVLDPYSCDLINANAATLGNETMRAAHSLPDTIRVIVLDTMGNPVANASVRWCPISATTDSGIIDTTQSFTITTNTAGFADTTSSIYDSNGDGLIDNVSFCILAKSGLRSSAYWMPISEPGFAWFNGMKGRYEFHMILR